MARDDFPPLMKKKSFIRTGEGSIASYDWNDFADGTGTVEFLALRTANSAGAQYGLTKNVALYTPVNHTKSGNITAADWADMITLNWDLSPFVSPRIVGGNFYAQVPISMCNNTSSENCSAQAVINIINSTTSTTIATFTSETVATGLSSSAVKRTFVVRGTITKSNFSVNDVLRVQVIIQAKRTAGSGTNNQVLTAYDPLNRTITETLGGTASGWDPSSDTTMTSTSKFLIPFKLDI
jgi:hypothetical protein